MNKLLLNTQIEGFTVDHGKEIVDFYKKHGFDTVGFSGIMYKKDDDDYRYYGCDEFGNFGNRKNYTKDCIKTITLEEAKELVKEKVLFTIKDLAEGKCALVNDGLSEELRKVLNIAVINSANDYKGTSKYYWSPGDYHWNNGHTNTLNLPIQSVKDFLKQININMKKEVIRFPFKLTRDNAQKILVIACSEWTDKLAKLWGKDMLLLGYTTITEEFYTEMRKACTSSQNTLFDEIFGKDVPDNSVDLSKPGMKDVLISIRSYEEYKHIGFYLDSSYTWEIVTDSAREKVLVPTKR